MNAKKMIVPVILATLIGAVSMETATAVRAVRARSVARGAALTTTPESRQENQEFRQNRRGNATPNQRAAAYNVARTRQTQRVNTAAAVRR